MRWLFAIWVVLVAILLGLKVEVRQTTSMAQVATPTATPTPVGPAMCTVSGNIVNADGSPFINGVITFNSKNIQVIGGVPVNPTVVTTNTDAQGNIRAISLPQGLVMQIVVCPPGQGGQSSACAAPYSAFIPFSSSSNFGQLSQGTSLSPPNPVGAPPQLLGWNTSNAVEAETLGGDLTLSRTGANAYSATVLKLNGITPGGTCTSPQVVGGISSSGVPSCVSPPAANLGGPYPDGATWTTTGIQNSKGIGIGMPVAAPTAGQTNPFRIASAGSTTATATSFTLNGGVNNQANAWGVVNPPLTSGTGLYSAYYANYCDPVATSNCTGPNDFYVVMQANGAGSTIAAPLTGVLQTSATGGMQINNIANSTLAMSSTGPITFTVNGNQVASMNADATFTAYNNAQGAINFGTSGSLGSLSSANFNISGGSHVVSGQWKTYPSATNATIIAGGAQPGNINFYANTGLTANANYTPTQVAQLTAAFNEATWTPQLQFGGASTGITYSSNNATCWSWSKFAYCNFAMVLTSKGTATGGARICGVPIPASGNGWMGGTVNFFYNFTGLVGTPNLIYGGDGTCVDIGQGNPNGFVGASDANFTANSNLQAAFWFLQ